MLKIDRSYRENLHKKIVDRVPLDIIEDGNHKARLPKDKWMWKYGYNSEYDMIIISKDGTIGEIIEINNLTIALPSEPKQIRFRGLPREKQKWKRYEVPYELVNFDKIYKDEKDSISVKLREVKFKNKDFIDADIKRKFNGDWFFNDGEPIYITGFYYFFLQHYKLTDMRRYGDFRMPQRDYFIFIEACFADDRCIGSLLLKSRRSAFSTSSGSIVLCKSITWKDGYFPIVSKKDTDAQILFDKHVVRPALSLPKHLQPQRTGEVTPKKELLFSTPKKKLTTNNTSDSSDEGLDTTINPLATTVDAYDGTQVTISINDEIGKFKVVDVNEYWEQHHRLCHEVGSEIVGKALCGSTAGSPLKGGKNYEAFYNDSKIDSRGESGFTVTGLYSIFIPADFSTMGFFDEWGYAIYHTPKEPILNELGKYKDIGVKEFLDKKEAEVAHNLKKSNARRRNNPRRDTDAFLDEEATNMYATSGMINLINLLKSDFTKSTKYKTEVFRFNLSWKNGIKDCGEVEMQPSANGRWMVYAPDGILPIPKEFRNKSEIRNSKKSPINGHIAGLGVDPFTANRTQYGGSKQGVVGMTSTHNDLSPNHKELTWLYYNFRGETFEDGVDDVIKACVYFSIPALIETNKDGTVKEMVKRGYRNYIANNPFKLKRELTPDELSHGGVYTSAANTDKQEQSLDSYIQKNFQDEIEDHKIKCPFLELNEHASEYTRETRKSKDDIVAWQLACALINVDPKKKEKPIAQNMQPQDLLDLFAFNQ